MRKSFLRLCPWGCLAALAFMAAPAFAFQQPGQRVIIQPNQPRQVQPERQTQPARQPARTSTHTGEFAAQGDGSFRMTIDGENQHTHRVTEQTEVTINGRRARLDDLRQGDQIRVTMGPNNTALKVEATRQEDQPTDRQTDQPADRQIDRQAGQQPPRQTDQQAQPERRQAGYRGEPDGGQTGQAWLGVRLEEGDQNQQGAVISQIYPSGPAARAGLYRDDVLIQINNNRVSSPDDAAELLEQAQPNEEVELTVQRDDQQETLTATLGDRRAFLGDEPNPQDQTQNGEGAEGFDESSTIPDHAIMLEQHRHFAQQHQRIEEKLDRVLEELEELRNQRGGQQREAAPESEAVPENPRR